MRIRPLAALLCSALAACTSADQRAAELDAALRAAPLGAAARFQLIGGELATVVIPCHPGELPPAVRQMLTAVAPDGERQFTGREWGPRGPGFRIEVRYQDPAHTRSVLLDEQGSVLERSHTVPLADVPQHVLATALRNAPFVDEAWIVSGPEQEEYWDLLLRDRKGALHAAQIGLDGRARTHLRRLEARVDG